jgi:hypothetical protein
MANGKPAPAVGQVWRMAVNELFAFENGRVIIIGVN